MRKFKQRHGLILGLMSLPLVTIVMADELPDTQKEITVAPKSDADQYIQPRDLSKIPAGAFGDKIRLGYRLFVDTQQLRGKYVGSDLNCSSCHLDAGMKANSSPLWAAYFAYPVFRKKNDKVNSYEERIQGCFTYSMNGVAPKKESPELVALSAYSYWMAMGGIMDKYKLSGKVPEISDADVVKGAKRKDFVLPDVIAKASSIEQRAKLPGRGFPPIDKPKQAYSVDRGGKVYETYCQACHGKNGHGLAIAGVHNIPPLWGPYTFNWGAGMHRVNTAAYFIHENMPFGKSVQLTIQQAWDVAAYINSKERPQDPRFKGDLGALQKRYHKNHQGYYNKSVNGGKPLGSGAFPNNPPKK